MMKWTPFLYLVFLVNTYAVGAQFYDFVHDKNSSAVNIFCGNNDSLFRVFAQNFEKYGIELRRVDRLDKGSQALHIIADAYSVPYEYFPKNYIVYQTQDFDKVPLTKSYFQKLDNALAVWEPLYKNIGSYSLLLNNYYFFDNSCIDPVLLPCMLSSRALSAYREVLCYSHSKDTDISSHLPVIFSHAVLHAPKIVIESGVRSGESSVAFKKALEQSGALLIGIDIDSKSELVYSKLDIPNSKFKIMDDLAFAQWWSQSDYCDKKADIIFIDTSHYYDHTMKELAVFLPLLAADGMFMFHDTNMCPLDQSTYRRINNTIGRGWDNKKGVVRAIKDFFAISFDESVYTSQNFSFDGNTWSLLHYPYCNGFTLIKRMH